MDVKKCIVNVIFKDGQVMPMQVELFDSIFKTEYHAFDHVMPIMNKIFEIKFVKEI